MKPLAVKEDTPLLSFLFRNLPDLKKTKVKQILKHGSVKVNGKVQTLHSFPLKAGDKIDFLSVKEATLIQLERQLPFRVVYEDEVLIVVDKPSGLLTMATDQEKERTLYFELTEFIKAKEARGRARVFIVHRLDKDASGLVVFARDEATKMALQDSWNLATKKYIALVEGKPEQGEGTVQSALAEDKFRRVFSTSPDAKDAKMSVTHYRVLKLEGRYSWIEATLGTGRKNQIRVHMADLGTPIAGDYKYGAVTNPLGRLGLHAIELTIVHPITEKKITFKSPAPFDYKD